MTDLTNQFRYASLPEETETLRREVRNFLAANLAAPAALDLPQSWIRHDADFSAKLGARGWIGMAASARPCGR
jgi:hypothetical protein